MLAAARQHLTDHMSPTSALSHPRHASTSRVAGAPRPPTTMAVVFVQSGNLTLVDGARGLTNEARARAASSTGSGFGQSILCPGEQAHQEAATICVARRETPLDGVPPGATLEWNPCRGAISVPFAPRPTLATDVQTKTASKQVQVQRRFGCSRCVSAVGLAVQCHARRNGRFARLPLQEFPIFLACAVVEQPPLARWSTR